MVNEHPLCYALQKNFTVDESDKELMFNRRIRFSIFNAMFALSCIHVVLSLFLFYAFNIDGRIRHIQIRSKFLVSITAMSVLIHALVCFFPGFIFPFPTWIHVSLSILVVPLLAFPISVRLFNFYGRYVFARAIAQAAIDDSSDGANIVNEEDNNQSNTSPNPILITRQGDNENNDNTHNRNLADMIKTKIDSIRISSLHTKNDDDLHSQFSHRTTPSNGSALSTFTAHILPEKETTLPTASEAAEVLSVVSQHQQHYDNNGSNLSSNLQRKRIISTRELLFLKFISSPKAQVFLLTVYIAPFIIIVIYTIAIFPDLNPIAGCYQGSFPRYVVDTMISSGVIGILFGVLAALSVRKFYDPFGIATECRQYAQYGGFVTFAGFVLDSAVIIPYYFSFDVLSNIGVNIMLFTSTTYQVYIGIKRYNNGKFSMRILWNMLQEIIFKTGGNNRESKRFNFLSTNVTQINSENYANGDLSAPEKLLKLLNNTKELEEFEKFLIGEFSVEMLRMYLECKRWEKNFFDSSETTRRARAKKIVEHFVDYDSIFEVNIPGFMRNEVIKAIENTKVDLSPDLFKNIQNEMLFMMDEPFFRFEKRLQEQKHKQ